jgi:hypothetical protein
MINRKILSSIFFIFIINTFSVTQAQNWPRWRGPNGDETSIATNIPTKWDSITNVVWKIPVPGKGYSSPIIWRDNLFITTALQETQEKVLLCYDCKNGKLTVSIFMCLFWMARMLWWQRTIFQESRYG